MNARIAGRSRMLAILAEASVIPIILLALFGSTSEAETITGTVGKPGRVYTAYNLVDADFGNQYTNDGLLYWPGTRAYRAGSGTPQYNRPQTVNVTYQVHSFYQGNIRLVGSSKAMANLGISRQYRNTTSAFMEVSNKDAFNYGTGYFVVVYVAWKDSSNNRLIAARTFKQNHVGDYRCVDFNDNGGRCVISRFQDTSGNRGDAYVRIWGVN